MRRALLRLAILVVLALPQAARSQDLIADLTQHLVAITTGFTGASVTLFGAVEGGGDIVVTVRGPDREAVVRRKSQVAGIWLNTDSVGFTNVPGFYQVLANRPVDDIVPGPLRQLHQIGLDALHLAPDPTIAPADAENARAELVASRQASGLFGTGQGRVDLLGGKLFRAALSFPATVPVGSYAVDIFLVRNGEIVAAQTTPLIIEQSGFEASVHDFAASHATLYGIVAVAAAAMAGWGASLLSRSA